MFLVGLAVFVLSWDGTFRHSTLLLYPTLFFVVFPYVPRFIEPVRTSITFWRGKEMCLVIGPSTK
jgi:hypothetical protein